MWDRLIVSIAYCLETMPDCALQLGDVGAEALAVTVSSIGFGALHAVTPLYFVWATLVR